MVIHCSHLIRVYGAEHVHRDMKFSDSLYAFHTYNVMDHDSFEIAV